MPEEIKEQEMDRKELNSMLKDKAIDDIGVVKSVDTPFGITSFSDLDAVLEQEDKIKNIISNI